MILEAERQEHETPCKVTAQTSKTVYRWVVNLPGLKAPKRPTQSQPEEVEKAKKKKGPMQESRAPPDRMLLLFLSLQAPVLHSAVCCEVEEWAPSPP